nr:PfkB family carbohydrate kinase [uncultured Actinomyces sp.]
MDPRFSRVYGALAGLALGDALGMPTQAMSPEQIRAVYGRITGLVDGDASQPYAPGMPAGSVTDDTEQALLVASLLVRGRGSSSGRVALDAGEFAHALLAWEDSMIERGSLDLLGPSTKAALERVRAGEDPLSVGGAGTTNGAAMRVTPIGIAISTEDPQAFADAVWSSCQVTHATRQGFQSAALVAAAVSMGIDTPRSAASDMTALLWKAVSYVDSLPERGAWTPDPDVVAATRRAMQLVANPASSSLECLVEQVGTSVASAQAIPMAFALLARDPSPQALLDAANLGGDTDTIGAIAGAILGAALGFEVFVGRGLAQVESVSGLHLTEAATALLSLRGPIGTGEDTQESSKPTTSNTPEAPTGTRPVDTATASSPTATASAGRVVLMGQILVDRVLQGARPIHGGGSEWARDGGTHVGGGFNALVAARRMGAEAISLSPIGAGPHASMIEAALAREGIVDAGPRVDGVDNGFCVAMIGHDAERTFISTKGAETMTPETAWADFVRTMNPGDVLYIDGYLMDHPANREAAEAALRVLPEGVRVLLDVSPVIGIPESLPTHHAIISMNSVEARAIAKQSRLDGYLPFDSLSCRLAQTLGRDTLIRLGASGAYFARSASPDSETSAAHIPTPTIDAVDTNGAGDAHTGVLAASLALGIPLERGLVLANCAGALASTLPGPASCPTREDIEAAADALSESGN